MSRTPAISGSVRSIAWFCDVQTGATMDIQTLFLKTMAQAIDDMWMRGGPQPNDDVLIAIEPRLARLLETEAYEPYEDDE